MKKEIPYLIEFFGGPWDGEIRAFSYIADQIVVPHYQDAVIREVDGLEGYLVGFKVSNYTYMNGDYYWKGMP